MMSFGGSGLDRAAELRKDAAALAGSADARAILFWRGKPMVSQGQALVRVPMDHPVMADASPDYLFLGRDGDTPVFAADFSQWEPVNAHMPDADTFLDSTEQHHPVMPDDTVFAELRAVMTALGPRDAELAATAKSVMSWHLSHRFCAKCGVESVMAMAGWQRDCPSCKAHHFPRTDPVVIMLITHGNSVLLGRSPGWPEGMYSLLAGFVEPGETIEAAVRREVYEEVGVRVGDVGYLACQPWPFPSSLMFGCRGDAQGRDLTIDPEEIEDAMWVSREELADAFAGLHPVLKPARKGAIAHTLLHGWLADTLD